MSLEQRGCGIHTTMTGALMVPAGQVVVVRRTIRRTRPVTPILKIFGAQAGYRKVPAER
jgi:hypothetical protein